MNVADFKRWHWIIAGLLVGLAMSYIWLGFEPAPEMRLNPLQFERLIGAKDEKSGEMVLSRLIVHPPRLDYMGNQVQVVSGKRLVRVAKKAEVTKAGASGQDINAVAGAMKRLPFEVIVPIPYVPTFNRGIQMSATSTIMDYLKGLEAQKIEVGYHYGWWQKPPAAVTAWTLGSVILIGGIWPTLLNMLIGAGFGPEKKEKSAGLFPGFGKKKADTKPAIKMAVTLAEQQRLDALNAKLEKDLAAAGIGMTVATANDDSTAGTVVAPAGPKVLVSSSVDAPKVAPGDSDEPKEYGGEFYPVVKPHHHVEEKPNK